MGGGSGPKICRSFPAEREDPGIFREGAGVWRPWGEWGARAVALLAAVLTWRGSGIEWIPCWRWHEKLMEVDHHV